MQFYDYFCRSASCNLHKSWDAQKSSFFNDPPDMTQAIFSKDPSPCPPFHASATKLKSYSKGFANKSAAVSQFPTIFSLNL